MINLKSYVYRAYLTGDQKRKFDKLYYQNSVLFGLLLKEKKKKIDNQEDESVFIKTFVSDNSELKSGNLNSYLCTYRLVNQLISKYRNHYINEFPVERNLTKYPRKIHFQGINFHLLTPNKNYISISKIGTFKIKLHRPLPKKAFLKEVIIEERVKGQFFINFTFAIYDFVKQVRPKRAIGLDYSSPHFYYDSENVCGDVYKIGNFNQEKIATIQKRMSNCVFGSKNYEKLKNKQQKLFLQVTNKRIYYAHKAANDILSIFDIVGVETLTLEKIAHYNNLGKNTYENAFNRFVCLLTYKAREKGKYLIKIPRFFPSTRICSHCGEVHAKLELSERVFRCSCGFVIDRDYNAAINIRNKAIEIFRKNNMEGEPNVKKEALEYKVLAH